jgi:hypothetical protein
LRRPKAPAPKSTTIRPNPGPNDKDLVPPRIQTSSFGGTGLNEILPPRHQEYCGPGLTDVRYATVTNGYDLGFHVYALKDAMVGYFPSSDLAKNGPMVQGLEQRRMAQHA